MPEGVAVTARQEEMGMSLGQFDPRWDVIGMMERPSGWDPPVSVAIQVNVAPLSTGDAAEDGRPDEIREERFRFLAVVRTLEDLVKQSWG